MFVAVALSMVLSACGSGDARTADIPISGGDPAVVGTNVGALRGVVAADHRLFAGIPYAAPPVGALRFAPPAPASPWRGERDATHAGPRCIQDPDADFERGHNSSEDCLTLNVWTPPVSRGPRPVMVWIHGGAFANGSSGIYDARWLTTHGDILVVTVNYRLGALGFLAHPALGAGGDVGNYGLADQQAALRWVHDNIAAFGGDPDKVTVAGESAGAMSVCDHLVAPGSAGLFRAAIVMSGPCQAQADLATARRASLDYAAAAGCRDAATAAACLRALPVDRLRKPVWYYGIGSDRLTGPVTGTAVLPVAPIAAFGAGSQPRVPVLIGTTGDEFTLFTGYRYLREGDRFVASEYPRLLAETFGPAGVAIGARYPVERYGGVAQAYSTAVTDADFSCVAERMAVGLARSGPVYAYEFNDRGAPAPDLLRTLPFPVGASHSLELRYLFDIGGAPPLNPAQRALSDAMLGYWTQFVRTGTPGGAWGEFNGSGSWMSLQPDGSRITTGYQDAHQCAFWAGLKRR